MSLRQRVATHKKAFFRAGWAKYDEARPGSLRLSPQAANLPALRRDYDRMQGMFFGDRPTFDSIMEALHELKVASTGLRNTNVHCPNGSSGCTAIAPRTIGRRTR